MLRDLKDKKKVKIISLTVALLFILGIAGIAVSQSGRTYAAGNSSNIGVVNHQMLVSQHPDMAKAESDMQAEVQAAKQDFDTKTANMNDKEKQDYYIQVQQRLNQKQQELIGPIFDKVDAAIKQVADSKGLSVVLDKGNVIYGGQDITDEVTKKLNGK